MERPKRAEECVLGVFHVAVEIREMDNAGRVGFAELNAAGDGEFVLCHLYLCG